jgi:hypothetical protein
MPYPHIFFLVQSQCRTVSQPPESRLNFRYKSFPSFAPFTYMILQTTQHARTHTHAPSTIHHLGKSPCGQMSVWANVFLGKCLSWQMSFWANVLLSKCLLGKCLSGHMSFWANVVSPVPPYGGNSMFDLMSLLLLIPILLNTRF